jgi:hypothetical protein
MMKTFFIKFGVPLASAILGGLSGAFCVKGASANQVSPFAELIKQQAEIEKQMEAMVHHGPSVMNTIQEPIFQQLLTSDEPAPVATTISVREDKQYVYYDIHMKDPQSAKVQTKIERGYLTVLASEVAKHKANDGMEEVQSVFEQTLPLSPDVDAKAVQAITDKEKIVLKFPKLAQNQDKDKENKAPASVPYINQTNSLTI